jgi:hypothetical protein
MYTKSLYICVEALNLQLRLLPHIGQGKKTCPFFCAKETAMHKETEEKLAKALTAETTELIPFLPYLLQDLWELGSNPRDIIKLIKKHITISENTVFLELACGKGACAVKIACPSPHPIW